MKSATVVGTRELKTRLGRYLLQVRRGNTILVTARNEPIAEIRPIEHVRDPTKRALGRLAASGALTLPTRSTVTRFAPMSIAGASAAAAVTADRDERG